MSREHDSGAGDECAADAETWITSGDDIDLMEIQELRTFVKEIMAKNRVANKEQEGRITRVKGFDTKNASKPKEWAGSVDDYKVWNVLFTAYLKSVDPLQN